MLDGQFAVFREMPPNLIPTTGVQISQVHNALQGSARTLHHVVAVMRVVDNVDVLMQVVDNVLVEVHLE